MKMIDEILIVAKTQFGQNKCCLSGIRIQDNRYLRLLLPGNDYHLKNSDFDIGDIWKISYIYRKPLVPPHVEDIIVLNRGKTPAQKISTNNNITNYITNANINIWNGPPSTLFNSKLQWTKSGSGYLPKPQNNKNYPPQSVGFWISDKDLVYNEETERYEYLNGVILGTRLVKTLKYKGFPTPLATIPTGQLIRVSLARFFKPENHEIEERCYLQLSGWYKK